MRNSEKSVVTAIICALASCGAAGTWSNSATAANIVVNGDFATGDLTGYTLSGNSFRIAVGTGVGPTGGDALGIGNSNPLGFVSQLLPTVTGTSYVLSFLLNAPDVSGFPAGYIADEFLVNVGGDASSGSLIGGTTLFDETNIPAQPVPVPFDYAALFAPESFIFTANSSSTNLIFGGFNNPSFLILADVSVSAVPEPSSLVILGAGVMGVSLMSRRRKV